MENDFSYSHAFWLGVFKQTLISLLKTNPELLKHDTIIILKQMIEKECNLPGIIEFKNKYL